MLPYQILLLVDDPFIGGTLEQFISQDERFRIAASLPVEESYMATINGPYQDAILIDLGWNVQVARQHLASIYPPPRSLVLFPENLQINDTHTSRIAGMLPRLSSSEKILNALSAVAAGLYVREKKLQGELNPSPEPFSAKPLAEDLTPRELEVLAGLFEGLSNKLIAHKLGISEHTAKFHVTSILGKLDAQSRTEAVIKAARMGLIQM